MLIDRLKEIVGPGGWISDPDDLQPYVTEWRNTWTGKTPLVVQPDSTDQVARVVQACAENGTAIVPQGGNTGLCGGAIPDPGGEQVLLSLSRLNRVRAVSPQDFSICVEAGCTLAEVQHAAEDAGRFFPLSLAAEGSCQIGGNLSTNAGGVNVVKYGTARQQVLGLEVVLADGTVWDGLRSLRKDTAGYDVKQLFIGSEGTLGIITAATLRLYPRPRNVRTAWVGLTAAKDAVALYSFLQERLAESLYAFELVPSRAVRFVLRHIDSINLPGGADYPWYVLLDAAMGEDGDAFETALLAASENGAAAEVSVAKNDTEAQSLWRLRHAISEAQKVEGASLKHDVSVPVGQVAEFLERGEAAVLEFLPAARVVAFGHVGDGNVHFNVTQPADMDPAAFLGMRDQIAGLVYAVVASFGGSISAEHGIGVLKRDALRQFRSDTELELMRRIAKALDPNHILNPGKVL